MGGAMMEKHLHFIADHRKAQLGLPEQFPGAENPFPACRKWRAVSINKKIARSLLSIVRC
ncbi:MAG TPA: hypothetical protein DCZ13_11100 [Porticoccaceae bacterium]|nr:hypothetical protein [Porticoccaceae bacterium]